ncbi:MAG: sugar phosphate nucleotidyltransferase [Parcubacteria group bacterium]
MKTYGVVLQINIHGYQWRLGLMPHRKEGKSDRYVVIMAGGSGKRLWPESRANNPKQFHRLITEDYTLLQGTHQRVKDLVLPEHLFVSTIAEYREIIAEQLPEVAPENILIEPCGRNTAPALAFVADKIYQLNPNAVILAVPSDHMIKEVGTFADVVQTMFRVVDYYPERIGLIGIKPTEPSTELGYIKMGNETRKKFAHSVHHVSAFAEKPSSDKAKEYFSDWQFLWNSGCFVFCASVFLDQIKKYVPEISQTLEQVNACPSEDEQRSLFSALQDHPIDTVVLEKLSSLELFVVPATLTWSDVGNWRSLHDVHCTGNPDHNYMRGDVVSVDTQNCFVFGNDKSVIATLGLKGIVIVQSGDVILVADRDRVKDVKEVVALLGKRGYRHLL